MSEERLLKACQGKTKKQGGLNVDEMRAMLKEKGETSNGKRDALARKLCAFATPSMSGLGGKDSVSACMRGTDNCYIIALDDISSHLPLIRRFRTHIGNLINCEDIQELRTTINGGTFRKGIIASLGYLLARSNGDEFSRYCQLVADELSHPTDGGTALEVSRMDVCVMQLYYEISARCTSVVVNDPDSHRIIHARTMDWDMPILKDLSIQVIGTIGGRPVCRAVTWVGMLGFFTAMKINCEKPFSISVNYRVRDIEGDVELKNTIGLTLLQGLAPDVKDVIAKLVRLVSSTYRSVPHLVYDLMRGAYTYNDAVNALRKTPLVSPVYFTIAGTARATIIARDPYPHTLPDKFLVVGTDSSPYAVIPNMDWWTPNAPDVMFSIERTRAANRYFKLVSNRTVENVWRFMTTDPIQNDETIYAALMIPSDGTLWVQLVGGTLYRGPRKKKDQVPKKSPIQKKLIAKKTPAAVIQIQIGEKIKLKTQTPKRSDYIKPRSGKSNALVLFESLYRYPMHQPVFTVAAAPNPYDGDSESEVAEWAAYEFLNRVFPAHVEFPNPGPALTVPYAVHLTGWPCPRENHDQKRRIKQSEVSNWPYPLHDSTFALDVVKAKLSESLQILGKDIKSYRMHMYPVHEFQYADCDVSFDREDYAVRDMYTRPPNRSVSDENDAAFGKSYLDDIALHPRLKMAGEIGDMLHTMCDDYKGGAEVAYGIMYHLKRTASSAGKAVRDDVANSIMAHTGYIPPSEDCIRASSHKFGDMTPSVSFVVRIGGELYDATPVDHFQGFMVLHKQYLIFSIPIFWAVTNDNAHASLFVYYANAMFSVGMGYSYKQPATGEPHPYPHPAASGWSKTDKRSLAAWTPGRLIGRHIDRASIFTPEDYQTMSSLVPLQIVDVGIWKSDYNSRLNLYIGHIARVNQQCQVVSSKKQGDATSFGIVNPNCAMFLGDEFMYDRHATCTTSKNLNCAAFVQNILIDRIRCSMTNLVPPIIIPAAPAKCQRVQHQEQVHSDCGYILRFLQSIQNVSVADTADPAFAKSLESLRNFCLNVTGTQNVGTPDPSHPDDPMDPAEK